MGLRLIGDEEMGQIYLRLRWLKKLKPDTEKCESGGGSHRSGVLPPVPLPPPPGVPVMRALEYFFVFFSFCFHVIVGLQKGSLTWSNPPSAPLPVSHNTLVKVTMELTTPLPGASPQITAGCEHPKNRQPWCCSLGLVSTKSGMQMRRDGRKTQNKPRNSWAWCLLEEIPNIFLSFSSRFFFEDWDIPKTEVNSLLYFYNFY